MTDIPGRQQLTGYRLRDYDDLIATLGRSRERQDITMTSLGRKCARSREQIRRWLTGKQWPLAPNLFDLADALGYDLALIPQEET